jgi:hypothetical protein
MLPKSPDPSDRLPGAPTNEEANRQLPIGDEIFLDHVAHFVRDAEAATAALVRCGFAPTPISIQVGPDPAGGTRPTGTGNITVMFDRGYAEILFISRPSPWPMPRPHTAASPPIILQFANSSICRGRLRLRPARVRQPSPSPASNPA